MTWEIGLLLVLIALIFALMVTEAFPPDLVALSSLAFVALTGLITPAEAFQSFANEAPITVAAMFILSFALQRTGAIEDLANKLRLMPKMGEAKLLLSLMVLVAAVSAFLNNTPVVVTFLPLVLGLAKHHQISASKLLIPLSFAAIFGGTCTLIGTSTNLAVSALVQEKYDVTIGLFDITLPGLILATAGLLYMILIGRHLLPAREPLSTLVDDLAGRLYYAEVEVSPGSKWIGHPLARTELARWDGVAIKELRRQGVRVARNFLNTVLEPGDRILVSCRLKALLNLQANRHLVVHNAKHNERPEEREGIRVVELLVMNNSTFAGQSLEDVHFQERSGAHVLAIHRSGEQLRGKLGAIRLRFGDTLLVKIPQAALLGLRGSRDLMILSDLPLPSPRRNKKPLVLAVFAAMVGLAATNLYPISLLAVTAVVVLVITRCIQVSEMYEAIDWRTVTMIIGMIALGTAVDRTGTGKWLAQSALGVLGDVHPLVILGIIYLITTTLTEMISNNAVAILMTPIAMETATAYGLSPLPFFIAIMFAASASFATPIGYQTNTFVYGAGGYTFRDFLRVGVPLNLLFWLVASAIIPLIYPF